MTLSDPEWLFYTEFYFAPVCISYSSQAGFRSLATLRIVVNVGELFARFPCDSTAFLFYM